MFTQKKAAYTYKLKKKKKKRGPIHSSNNKVFLYISTEKVSLKIKTNEIVDYRDLLPMKRM